MERLSYSSRCALVIDLVKRLREQGSWCGETHLQKAMYILQDIAKANFGYKFVTINMVRIHSTLVMN